MDLETQYKVERIKCYYQLRVEEYKDRRSEIDTLIKDTKNIEIYALIGVVAYYAWLLTHCVSPLLPWLIPIAIPLLGAWRAFENIHELLNNARYVRLLENELFAIGPITKGWESYLGEGRHIDPNARVSSRHIFMIERSTARVVFWILLIFGTITLFGLVLFHQFDPSSACKATQHK